MAVPGPQQEGAVGIRVPLGSLRGSGLWPVGDIYVTLPPLPWGQVSVGVPAGRDPARGFRLQEQ